MSLSYCVVTPAKDEEELIGLTIESMVHQTLKPLRWVIVDDGSKDRTAEIVSAAAEKYEWISFVRSSIDRDLHPAGVEEGKEIAAFYCGFNFLSDLKFDIIVKLDADLSFEPDFFQTIVERFELDPELGLAGGTNYILEGDEVVPERMNPNHVPGPQKCYRYACFQQIDGLHCCLGWDTIDEYKARMLGWKTKRHNDLKVIHYRKTGSGLGLFKRWWIWGKVCYIVGYHPLYVLARGVYRFSDRPYFLGGLTLIAAYIFYHILRPSRPVEQNLRKFIKREQISKLLPWR